MDIYDADETYEVVDAVDYKDLLKKAAQTWERQEKKKLQTTPKK